MINKKQISLNNFSDDFVFFNRQLVNLLKTDLPVVPGLRHLAKDIRRKKISAIIDGIASEIESGKTLTEAFTLYSSVFPPLYLTMIRAGEISGKLPEILQGTALYAEKMNKLRKKLKEVSVYPAILVVTGFLLACFIVAVFTPPFLEFASYMPGARLPAFIALMVFLYHHWAGVLIVLAVLFLAFLIVKRMMKNMIGGFREKITFRLPLYGKILRCACLSRFAGNLGILISSGVPLTDALNLAGPTSGSRQIEDAAEEMSRNLTDGRPWTEVFFKYPIFPNIFAWTIAVSEKKGDIENTLSYLSDFYDREFDRQIHIFIHFFEPMIILCLGIFIAIVAVLAVKSGLGGILNIIRCGGT
jgi:type IV pilus assembly protein PilC